MNFEVEYTDIIKAYQARTTDFLNQLITVEAKLHASTAYINKLEQRTRELEAENAKLSSLKATRTKKTESKTDTVIDYN